MAKDEGSSLVVSIKEAAQLLSVSESTVKRLIQARELRSKKIGRSTRIFRDSIEKYLEG